MRALKAMVKECPSITSRRLDQVTRPMVRSLLAQAHERGLGLSSQQIRLSALRWVFHEAVEQEYREIDPTQGIKMKSPPRKYRHLLTEDQLHYPCCLMPVLMWLLC